MRGARGTCAERPHRVNRIVDDERLCTSEGLFGFSRGVFAYCYYLRRTRNHILLDTPDPPSVIMPLQGSFVWFQLFVMHT
jgi:hypothetical protein